MACRLFFHRVRILLHLVALHAAQGRVTDTCCTYALRANECACANRPLFTITVLAPFTLQHCSCASKLCQACALPGCSCCSGGGRFTLCRAEQQHQQQMMHDVPPFCVPCFCSFSCWLYSFSTPVRVVRCAWAVRAPAAPNWQNCAAPRFCVCVLWCAFEAVQVRIWQAGGLLGE
jgi:hypothetical protein